MFSIQRLWDKVYDIVHEMEIKLLNSSSPKNGIPSPSLPSAFMIVAMVSISKQDLVIKCMNLYLEFLVCIWIEYYVVYYSNDTILPSICCVETQTINIEYKCTLTINSYFSYTPINAYIYIVVPLAL